MAENPYMYHNPISDPARFAGRTAALQFMQTHLVTGAPGQPRGALALLGSPQIGKSSLLRVLRFHLDARYCPVRVSLRAGTVAGEAAWLTALAQTIPDALELLDIQSARLPSLPGRAAELRTALLGEYLTAGLHAMRQGRQLLVLVDNADRLLTAVERGALPGDSFELLGQLLDVHPNLHLLFALDARFEADLLAAGPPFEAALCYRLGPLPRDEHNRLLLDPVAGTLAYTPEALDTLYDLTGGHPYLANVIAHQLFDWSEARGHGEPVGVADVEAAVEPALNQAADVLGATWRDGSTQAQLVLTALTALCPDEPPAPVRHDDIAAWLLAVNRPLDPRSVNATWRQLEYEGVLALSGEGKLIIRGGLQRRWLRGHVDLPRAGAPAASWQRIGVLALVALVVVVLLLALLAILPGPGAGEGAGSAATITLDFDLQATTDAYNATQT
ncbi:MAG: ATP-binding protein, partial [Anaerolineae bacterium]|nr:ATP-binding protein [Anaerolineae bacterium]